MPIAEYKGPPINHTAVLKHLIGETIKAAFVDGSGQVWLTFASGHSMRFGGFSNTSPAFEVIDPILSKQEREKFENVIRQKIQELRDLAPGLTVG